MKKIWIGLLIICMVIFVGCESTVEEAIENKIGSEYGDEVNVDVDDNKVTVETEEGVMTAEVKNEDSWCQEGSTWDLNTAEADANMVVVGIESSGKYAGYCHVTYDMTSEETDVKMDYYFNEDGDGYQVMDVNGQKMESEWSN